MTNWITDRPPTEADADANGDVLALWCDAENPALTWSSLTEWEVVAVCTRIPWRHTSTWRSPDGATPTTTTTTIPRSGRTCGTYTGLFQERQAELLEADMQQAQANK